MTQIKRLPGRKTEIDPALFETLDSGLRSVFACCVSRKNHGAGGFDNEGGQDWARAAAENARALMELHRDFTPQNPA